MRRSARTTIAVCLATLALPLAGCGKKMTFWHIQTSSATRQVVDDAVKRFSSSHPEVPMMAVAFKNDSYKQKLSQAMASLNVPDVFQTWGGGVLESYVEKGLVADLTDEVKTAGLDGRLLPAALRCGTIDGKIYAVPMDVSVVVMWYNREMFAKHGVDVPRTVDDLKSACLRLRHAGVTPIALGNKDKWPGAFHFIYLATRIGGTEPFSAAARRSPGGTFEHPSFIEAGRRLQELVRIHAFNEGAAVLTYDDARDLFMNEKAAMMLMGTWFLADLRSDRPGMLEKVDCFAFPTASDASSASRAVVGGINSAYAVSSRSACRKEAFELLRELVSDRTASAWANTGRIPALKAEAVSGLLEPLTLKAAALLFDAPGMQLYYDQYLPPKLGELHKDTTQSLIADAITPQEAAARMESLALELSAQSRTDPAK